MNGNGVKDPGEPGLSGWTVYLDANANGQLDPGELTPDNARVKLRPSAKERERRFRGTAS